MTPDEKRKMLFELAATITAGRVGSAQIQHPAEYIRAEYERIFKALETEWEKGYVKNLR
ncbi:hypothetical protein [Candidatus Symbiopectobacterium sp. NZEC135]|uniref:hypothetical protein n=1 Tax=Candidatus Symbiopectobacterium sp. NZEC135 TaxID=2820471 RepID=UPI002226E49E|nr:hypothetical protein [Candidatus Symbiopectobacterium sp. NZEC135]MCW2479758.1 hypothetical protein [Candidatus Symbiopectobacterium sp. NZEC135]